MATVMARPTIGSASSQPNAAPAAPSRTASDVSPSVRAWWPSASRAADRDDGGPQAGPAVGQRRVDTIGGVMAGALPPGSRVVMAVIAVPVVVVRVVVVRVVVVRVVVVRVVVVRVVVVRVVVVRVVV